MSEPKEEIHPLVRKMDDICKEAASEVVSSPLPQPKDLKKPFVMSPTEIAAMEAVIKALRRMGIPEEQIKKIIGSK